MIVGAAAAVLVGLLTPAVWAAEGDPSDAQFDLAAYLSGLGVGSEGGTISTAFSPAAPIEDSTNQTFGVWAATIETDEVTLEAVAAELVRACQQLGESGSDLTFTTAFCADPEAVNDIFGQPDPPVAVVAESEEGWSIGTGFQLTIVGVVSSRPVYQGAEGDPNDGNNTGYDFFWAGDAPALALTTHSETGFDFVPFEQGVVLVKNPGWIAYLLPGSLFAELADPEVWINDGGWDQAPVSDELGRLLFGPPEFVTAVLSGEEGTADDEAEPETPSEEETQTEPETRDEPEPPPEDPEPEPPEEPVTETAAESASTNFPVAAVAGGGVAVAAAVGTGVLVARRRRRGKCEELLTEYDRAYEAWAEAARQMNEARDAYLLGDTAGTEEAREAQEAAEQAEREAYNAERRAWNNYLDCTGAERAATRAAPARPEPPATDATLTGTAGAGVVTGGGTTVDAQPEEGATAAQPVKPVPCKENAIRNLEKLESLRGSLTLAYNISSGTEGIRTTREEAAELMRQLNGLADQISDVNDAVQDVAGGAGALVADAAATVLELTARLGAGTAAAADQMLDDHRVHNFTYEEHRVVVDMQWNKFDRCVNGSWKCFYDLEVKDFHEVTIPQTESFEGNRKARDKRMKPFIRKGENAVARDRPRFEAFLEEHKVGPC